ncbi:MAG: DoxX family protein [Allosphingosinicella sp.]
MTRLHAYAPRALALLRIVTGMLFMQHGLQKLLMWPSSEHHPGPVPLLSLFGIGGVLELFGGLLIVVGLFTRPVAFVLAGEMAVAYWMFHFAGGTHMPNGWMPVVNGGDSAIQFCFTFLYLVFAGAGAWSFDAARESRIARVD